MNDRLTLLLLPILFLTLLIGCQNASAPATPSTGPAEAASSPPLPVGHTVSSMFTIEYPPTALPGTAISKDKAVQLALDWCKEKWPTTEVTRSSTLLGRCKDKLIWPVSCTLGHPEIAAFSATVYIDAANGKLLGVHVPKGPVR